VLGFYMSSHPLTRHATVLQALATHRCADLAAVAEGTEVVLGGMIVGVQVKNVSKSRSGLTRMGKLTFEDLSGTVPAMLWPEEFAKFEELVKNDTIGFVRGKLDRRRDPAELIISKVIPLAQGPAELSCGVVVTLRKGLIDEPKDLESLLRKIRIRPGNLDVFLEILGLAGVRRAIYRVGPSLKIRYDDQLVADLEATVQAGNVRLVGPRKLTARVEAPAPAPATSRIPSEPDENDSPIEEADDL
jgi:DNA polymerase III subunit alpha